MYSYEMWLHEIFQELASIYSTYYFLNRHNIYFVPILGWLKNREMKTMVFSNVWEHSRTSTINWNFWIEDLWIWNCCRTATRVNLNLPLPTPWHRKSFLCHQPQTFTILTFSQPITASGLRGAMRWNLQSCIRYMTNHLLIKVSYVCSDSFCLSTK